MYKHILVATDGSQLAERGVDHGIALAASVNAQVTIVTVTEPWSALDIANETRGREGDALERFHARGAVNARKILDHASLKAVSSGIQFGTLHIPDTYPAEGIIRAVEARGCDLIVMSSHGRRGVNRLLLGSEAYEVLTLSEVCPRLSSDNFL